MPRSDALTLAVHFISTQAPHVATGLSGLADATFQPGKATVAVSP